MSWGEDVKTFMLLLHHRSINTHPNHEPGSGDDFNVEIVYSHNVLKWKPDHPPRGENIYHRKWGGSSDHQIVFSDFSSSNRIMYVYDLDRRSFK